MTIVATRSGEVRGALHGEVIRFAGIPFAAPPVGDLRYRPPVPPDDWSGVRDATRFGPTSIQGPSPLVMLLGGEQQSTDEDCLYLNVWTPAADDRARPVFVWIHGGGFFMGAGSEPAYDGSMLAARGDVVIVTVNYRLGALGFLYLDDLDPARAGSGNLGIADQVQALRWVRDNIAGFGGDPDNVTIFGESAGGMSVATLLGCPAARGLFHRAIPQSGAAHNISAAKEAIEVRDELVVRLGGGGLERLLVATPDELLVAQSGLFVSAFSDFEANLAAGLDPVLLPFQPVHDDAVLPEPPLDAVRAGSAAGIPMLVGTTLEEWKLFSLMDPTRLDEPHAAHLLGMLVGGGADVLERYREALPDGTPNDWFGAAVTDLVFRQPAIRLAEAHLAHEPRTFMYLFSWRSPAFGGVLGSCHAIDVPFVFGNREGLGAFLGDAPPVALFDAVQESWLAFARTGDPSNDVVGEWPAYDRVDRATMEIEVPCRVTADPERDRRELWETVL